MVNIRKEIRERRLSAFFFLGVAVGSMLMNLFSEYFSDRLNLYSTYFLNSCKNIQVESIELFSYRVRDLFMEVFAVLFFSAALFGKKFVYMYVIYKGVAISLLISQAVIKYGIGGILIYLITIFPHYITYGIMVVMLVKFGCYAAGEGIEFRKRKYQGMGYFENIRVLINEFKGEKNLVKIMVLFIMLIFATAFLESYVSIGIVRNFL